MTALRVRFAAIQARVEGILDGMSPRDRSLLLGLVMFFSVVVVIGGAWTMNGKLASIEKIRDTRIEDLNYVNRTLAEYQQAQVELERIEKDMASFEGQDLSSFLEKAADSAEIRDRLDSVRENSVVEMGDLEEKNYSIKLTRVTLDQLVGFLYQVEATGYPLKITSAKFKRVKVSGEWMINVTLEIAAYRLLNTEG
ncbi:MAG: type II secretory pathway component PulM [Cognaticolwellia sp.]|jgi:type II secretory pathway component PulM